MNIGIRLGAPLEPTEWTYERILQVHGDIKGYVKDYNMFSADDDANGPAFFIRSLYDDAHNRELKAEDVGRAWLNYCREGIGMIWWGGENLSSEHRSFLNLKKGIEAPKSGSVEQNGVILAEQIGGQIFVDSWGLIYPHNIEKAALYAEIAASVSHDKEGLYGARFIAACISSAFSAHSVDQIINDGLSMIPKDSTYTKVVESVLKFHKQNPSDFRECRQYLEEEWGYDKYPGVCHIIPNAGVCILALLYGEGDFSKTIEIATMCSWDTDSNTGSVGTIIGVLNGIDGIPDHYRKPINDCIVASSVSGYLNIIDIPSFSAELAVLAYEREGVEPPENLSKKVRPGEIYFDFDLPGTTHGFRTDNTYKTRLSHNAKMGEGSLEVIFDRMYEGEQSKVFYKPFYHREEFSDEKYKPNFSPKVYSGQKVTADIYLDKWQGAEIYITPYIRDSFTKKEIKLEKISLVDQLWNDIQFVIPESNGALIDELGFIIESSSSLNHRAIGSIFIDNFHVYGNSTYSIDFSKQVIEFNSVTPFAHNNGDWLLHSNYMKCLSDENCSSYTGNYYTKDAVLEAEIQPIIGDSHLLIFRAQGIQRQYLVGFDGIGKVSLLLNDFGYQRLMSVSYEWGYEITYNFKVIYKGKKIQFFIKNKLILEYEDNQIPSGMIGFGFLNEVETNIYSFKIQEIN
ncbi:hypothetical protein BB777_15775 [Planococcus faecalis]|nr:hypothetical protein BB777_15775 [Planococcus faecalis]